MLESIGIPVWVDTSGQALAVSLQAHPSGIKVNQLEIQELTGIEVTDAGQAVQAANALAKKGIQAVSITLGEQGAVLWQSGKAWSGKVPPTRRLSTVGSGDAFLGGLLCGYSNSEGVEDVLRIAIAAGAANTLSMGGGRFTRQEYEALLPEISVERIL
jgi:fructose-1-phosphate kinase PfkB-like protein